ncbi:MAG: phosphohydrolase, partial [Clostridia bacterium]|nr:phosphohydrolase [Clostridia bacterium]
KYLHKLYNEQTHRNFNHNIQSVRILTDLFPNNVSLQVLDGVAGHNGEEPEEELVPAIRTDYNKFIEEIEECYTDPENKKARRFRASTLEGLVVRYADVIAYIISDRLDYMKIKGPQMFVTANRKVNSAAMSRYEVDIIENR